MSSFSIKKLIRECVKEELEKLALDQFTKSYIEVALATSDSSYIYNHGEKKSQWDTEYDEDAPSGEEEYGGEPLSKKYTIDDIDKDTLKEIIRDCKDFQRKWREWYDAAGWSDSNAGYDFWLTRNGHGAGFWDRSSSTLFATAFANEKGEAGIEEVREVLTNASKSYGSYSLYLGDGQYDGTIFGTKG